MNQNQPLSDGFLLLDKPPGLSSYQSIKHVKRFFKKKRIGFAGTLDPDATGLLIIGVGKATKLLGYFTNMEKRYTFDVVPGIETDTYDISGEVIRTRPVPNMSESELINLSSKFIGWQKQKPPVYSALKINGKRACDRVRAGEVVQLQEREIHISSIEPLSLSPRKWSFQISCSKGTYVRTLAYDMGQIVGCGAAASNIRRLSIGPCDVSDACEYNDIQAFSRLRKMDEAVFYLPKIVAKPVAVDDFLHGRTSSTDTFCVISKSGSDTIKCQGLYKVEDEAGAFIGLGSLNSKGYLFPKKSIL